jgi:hypothetical protein
MEERPHRVTIGGKTRLIYPNATYDTSAVKRILGIGDRSRAIEELPSGKLGDNKIFDGQELIDHIRGLCKKKPK